MLEFAIFIFLLITVHLWFRPLMVLAIWLICAAVCIGAVAAVIGGLVYLIQLA